MSNVTGQDLVTVATVVTAGAATITAIIVTHADGVILAGFFMFLGGLGLGRGLRKGS